MSRTKNTDAAPVDAIADAVPVDGAYVAVMHFSTTDPVAAYAPGDAVDVPPELRARLIALDLITAA